MSEKIRLAIATAATCDGCDMAIIDIDGMLLDLFDIADIVFSQTYVDTKYEDLEKMPDGYITASLVHGSMRDEENVHLAKLLRKKSKLMVAFGACSAFGGIPSLANSVKGGMGKIWQTVYGKDTASTVNPEGTTPQHKWKTPLGRTLTLPEAEQKIVPMDKIIDVDYYLPGCPPAVSTIKTFVGAVHSHVTKGTPLPPKGAIIASEKTLCEECPRVKPEKYNIKKINRPYEIELDPEKCFLEQGVICLGVATRAGCGAQCTKGGNMPCRGCYGPTGLVLDQGASMLSALGSILDMTDHELDMTDDELEKIVAQVPDPLGTFYRYTFGNAIINEAVEDAEE